jgi:bifunctional DNA-binding transcriptional regulator/antitoxin component of YhaV-PrlF toxin-antitoxin module
MIYGILYHRVSKIYGGFDPRCHMNVIRTKLGPNGEVVIPPEYLQVLGIEVGDTVILRLEDGEVRILTPRQGIRKAQELVHRYLSEKSSLSGELIAERRLEN